MNVFAYWILLKSDHSCIWVLVVSILTLSTSFFRNFEPELLRECGIFCFCFIIWPDSILTMILSRKILSKTLWLVWKNSGEALWNGNLLLNGNMLLFAIIFLNVLLTLELLHFVLNVEWDYQYRKFEENVVCWHHHVCHISESLHSLYVYALRHVRISCIEIWSQWP